MSIFKIEGLKPIAAARVVAQLDKLTRRNGVVRTLRAHIELDAAAGPLELKESDGMIDYSRTKFNRCMSQRESDAYIARLKAKTYFWVNDWQVPKVVFDVLKAAQA